MRKIVFLRASCRIRTNDPEITNHVLWPTELKRRVGKLLTSHRSTYYLCYVPVLEDSQGAGRARLTRFAAAKVRKKIIAELLYPQNLKNLTYTQWVVITQHLRKHSHSGGFAFVRVDLHLFGRICNPAALSESICNALLAD